MATEQTLRAGKPHIGALAGAGATLQLQIHLVDHADARSADRMAEALQAAVDLAGDLAVAVVEAVEHVLHGAALGRDVEVLQRHEFGNGEAVVAFHETELLTRALDAGLAVGTRGRDARRGEIAAVPGVVLLLDAVGAGDLQRLDRDDVLLAEAAGDLRCGHDGRRRAVADAAAVVQAERIGDQRRVQHVGLGDGALQVRLWVLYAVGMALDRDVGHGALQLVAAHAMFGAVGRGKLSETAGRRKVRPPQRRRGAGVEAGQAAEAGVLQLLDAQRQRDVAGTGRHGVDGRTEGVGARGAVVLDAAHRDVVEAQGLGQRQAGFADMDFVETGREPCGVDLLALDAGVGDRLLEGADHQFLGALVPVFAEAGATHAENGDLVANARGHVRCLPRRVAPAAA